MRLPPFRLHRPRTLDEALETLDRYAGDAQVYMGGTELLLVMKLGFASPEHLVDCKNIAEMQGMSIGGPDEWSIGAAVTHREIELDPRVERHLPELAGLQRQIANVRVRNAGTLGGNLCFAEPHSDPAALLIALGAEVELASLTGLRRMPLEDFILGALATDLREDEVMLRVTVPAVPGDWGVRFRRLAFKERPVVNVAHVRADGSHRVVFGAVGSRPARLRSVEALLEQGVDDADALAHAAMEEVQPQEDLEGSVEYKRHLVGVMMRRVVA